MFPYHIAINFTFVLKGYFFIVFLLTVNHSRSSQSQKTETLHLTNQNSKQLHLADAKCGKMCMYYSRLVSVLFLIGLESGAIVGCQSPSEAMQNQRKRSLLGNRSISFILILLLGLVVLKPINT